MSTPTYTLEAVAPHIVRLDDEALYTCIAHAGASMYDWYQWYTPRDDERTLYLTIEDDTNDDGYTSKLLTVHDLRMAIARIVVDALDYTQVAREVEWGNSECDSDVDADIADIVLQVAVLGRVVYG
jgi:hypothetical protein